MPRKIVPRYYKPREDALIIENALLTSFEEVRHFEDGRTKTCFRCLTPKGNQCLCIFWDRTPAEVGDLVFLKGRLKPDGTFIVWNMMYKKRINEVNKVIQPATPLVEKGGNELNDS